MPQATTVPVTLTRGAFRAILQRGVGIPLSGEVTVRVFLQEILGLDPEYVEEKLQTVFLDGQPVDDFDGPAVRPGAVLALSGAMPGLAGATMRRGGYYSRMREGITHGRIDTPEEAGESRFVVVKLFNRPLEDLADAVAARSLLVPADALDRPDSKDRPRSELVDGSWVLSAVTLV